MCPLAPATVTLQYKVIKIRENANSHEIRLQLFNTHTPDAITTIAFPGNRFPSPPKPTIIMIVYLTHTGLQLRSLNGTWETAARLDERKQKKK